VFASREWQRATQDALARCYADAACTAAGPVPTGANAIRFNDQSELLACLARDFVLGDVPANWWWQTWLRAKGRSTLESVLDAWLRDARHIPAAMAALHRGRLAEHFARVLAPRGSRSCSPRHGRGYDLSPLAAATSPNDVARLIALRRDRPADARGGARAS
jgi:hypothetical protein